MKPRPGRRASNPIKSRSTIHFVLLSTILTAAATGFFLTLNRLGAIAEDAVARASDVTANSISLEKTRRVPYSHPDKVLYRGNSADTRAVAGFRDHVFAASAAGLIEISDDGTPIRHFTVADGLPETDLTSLQVFRDELFIGTRGSGLVSFDGNGFFTHSGRDFAAKSISMLASDDESLFVGTIDEGLFKFDGRNLTPVEIDGRRIAFPVSMHFSPDLVAIGTFDSGVYLAHRGNWRHFDISRGLGSNRVTGLAHDGTSIVAATDLGIFIIATRSLNDDAARFEQVRKTVGVCGLTVVGDRYLFGTESGTLALTGSDRRLDRSVDGRVGRRVRLQVVNGRLVAFGMSGIARVEIDGGELLIHEIYAPRPDELPISEISSVAFASGDRLAAGGFRGGIYYLDRDLRLRSEIETEARDINSITLADRRLLVGAMNGAFEILPGKQQPGRISDESSVSLQTNTVTRIHTSGSDTIAVGTNEGLALFSERSVRRFSTLNGLPSNSVFLCVALGDSIFAATMSGLAVIRNDRVAAVMTSSNSRLPHNWITALASHNGKIIGGTYGGGLFLIDATGEIFEIGTPAGARFINPHAIVSDDENVFAGTTTGILIFNVPAASVVLHHETLPSKMVLSIAADGDFVYAGTNSGMVRIEKAAMLN